MSELTCGICLDDLKSPVSTPCGHLHCKRCMHEHVKSGTDAIQSTCPTCRTPFYTVTLDPTFVPAKYQPFIVPAIRRIYLNTDPSRASAASRQLQEQLTAFKKENEDLTSKLKGRDRDIKLLMTKCESTISAAATHAKGERDARLENKRLRQEMNRLMGRYEALQVKISGLEHQAGFSGAEEASTNDDPRRDHPRNQSRLIHSPSRIDGIDKRHLNESSGQTCGSTNTPTIVNKRKYTASNASLSSSSSVSSTPSSPAPEVDHEAGNAGERLMLRLPRRDQMAKRPRLGLGSATSRGDSESVSFVSARQTLAPPPVFKRRPPTPFNRSVGKTSTSPDERVESLGCVEGSGNDEIGAEGSSPNIPFDLSSDDSLNLPLSR